VACALVIWASGCTTVPEPLARGADQQPVTTPIAGTAYENVCHLLITRFPGGTFDGSAVLYRGRYLLTAGHNTYQDRSRIRRIEVRCGVADAREPGASVQTVEAWQTLDADGFDWFGFPDEHDFGVIRLNEPIATTRQVELADCPPPKATPVRLAGYPGRPIGDAKTLKQAVAPITGYGDGTVSYAIETAKGNSGGPVWREPGPGADGNVELVAIHVQPGRGRVVDRHFIAQVEDLIDRLDKRAAERGRE
jgi:V8-like Glu-specific endopeptidase